MKKKVLTALFAMGISLAAFSYNASGLDGSYQQNNVQELKTQNNLAQQNDKSIFDDESLLDQFYEEYLNIRTTRIDYHENGDLAIEITVNYEGDEDSSLGIAPVFYFGDKETGKMTLEIETVNINTEEKDPQLITLEVEPQYQTLSFETEPKEGETSIRLLSRSDIIYNNFKENYAVASYKLHDIYTNVSSVNVPEGDEELVVGEEANYNDEFIFETDEYYETPSQEVTDQLLSVEVTRTSISDFSYSYSITVKLDLSLVGENEEDQIMYTVGYYDEANYRPAKLRVTLNSGEQYEGDLQRQTGVGITASLGINYASSLNSVCDVQLPYKTQESDIAKIELVNVFFIDELSNGSFYEVFPRFSDEYEIEISKIGSRKYYANDYMNITSQTISKFGEVYCLSLGLDLTVEEAYKKMYDNFYFPSLSISGGDEVFENIENGLYYYRTYFSFSSFNEERMEGSYFRIIYNDGSIDYIGNKVSSKIQVYAGKNSVNFFLEGLESLDDIKTIDIFGITLQYEIASKESDTTIANSSITFKFGYLSTQYGGVYDVNGNKVSDGVIVDQFDLNLIFILFSIIYALVFILGDIGLFFFMKNKYKDDEFKRVRPKSFFITSLYALICTYTMIADFIIIGFRVTLFNNTPRVMNIMDIIIIVFTIVAFLMCCYFIRRFYIAIKDHMEKVKREKLKLGVNEEDSSGVAIAFSKSEDKKELENKKAQESK